MVPALIIINDCTAENTSPMTIPARTKLIDFPPVFMASRRVSPKAIRPPKMAQKAMRYGELMANSPKNVKPDVRTITAKVPAPDDTPMMYGSTRGFLMTAWYMAPATESPIPTAMAASTRGRRWL